MKLNVGKVIFVLDKKTRAVVPCQLVEILSSVTAEGERVQHIVTTPGNKRKFKLEEYSEPWFSDYESAYKYLKDAAISLVDQTMKRARQAAEKSFQYSYDPIPTRDQEVQKDNPGISITQEKNLEEPIDVKELSDHVYVDMAGQKVKVTLPKELSNGQ